MRYLTFVLALALASVSHAMPIMYDEPSDGDLNGQTLTLDVGVNTVSGDWTLAFPDITDYDPFSFIVPAGSAATGVTLAFDGSGVFVPAGLFLVTRYFFFDSVNTPLASPSVLFPGTASPLQPLAASLPLAADTYRIEQSGFFLFAGTSPSTGDGGTVPYTWMFTVEALDVDVPPTNVPEPGTLGLIGAGLLGLGFARRKRDQTLMPFIKV